MATELLATAFGYELPPHRGVSVEAGDFTDVRPTEYRADIVVELADRDELALGGVVEVPLRPDEDKR
jgi:hypothetical protein